LIYSGLASVIQKGYVDNKNINNNQQNNQGWNPRQNKSTAPHVSCAPSGDEGPTVEGTLGTARKFFKKGKTKK
jgi:hypothetical protein